MEEEMMRHLKKQSSILLTAVLILGLFSFLGTAHAMKWFLGSDTELSCDVTLTYALGIRVPELDASLFRSNDKIQYPSDPASAAYLEAINRDDGKQNFDYYDITNNKITALADIELRWKNIGVFVRPKAMYDHAYMVDNSNTSPGTNNAYQGGVAGVDEAYNWADEIEDIHGANAEILDAFAYANVRLGPLPLDIRVGNQVISWGESTFIPGISFAQAPIDASAAQAAGTEVKEIYLPTGSALIQTGIGDLGLRGYYQWEWKKTRLMEGGTFFSQYDASDEIKAPFLYSAGTEEAGTAGMLQRVEDIEAKDDGQYGVAVTYLLPWAATEVGYYFLNYHDKSFTLWPGYGGGYNLQFQEDIKLHGVSVSSCIGDTQVYAEGSYRHNMMAQTAANPPMHAIGDYMQWNAGFTHVFSPGPFGLADRSTVAGEVAYGQQLKLEDTEVGLQQGGNEEGLMYVVVNMNEWFQVFNRTDLGLDFIWQDTPIGSVVQFALFEHSSAVSVTGKVTYNDVWKFALTYENRLYDNFLEDQDTLSLKLSYTF